MRSTFEERVFQINGLSESIDVLGVSSDVPVSLQAFYLGAMTGNDERGVN